MPPRSRPALGHLDLDAFYTQVEVRRNPALRGQPVVVVQYNPNGDLRTLLPSDDRLMPESPGTIIAVSYEARAYGVKRNMLAQVAKKLCPSLNIVQVPVAHGKADLTIYRDAGAAVISVLSSSSNPHQGVVCERASVDEAYLDLTAAAQELLAKAEAAAGGAAAAAAGSDQQSHQEQQPSGEQQQQQQQQQQQDHQGGLGLPAPASFDGWHIAGMEESAAEAAAAAAAWWQRDKSCWAADEAVLAAAALIVSELRAAVHSQLGFTCSAGIAHSKLLAKIGSGLHKPAQQTLVPSSSVQPLLLPLPLPKLRQLGGKFGSELMSRLGISTVGELQAVPLPRLAALVGDEQAAWLSRLAHGDDGEEVKPRLLPRSVSCGKSFRGKAALTGLTAVAEWLLQLAHELAERLEVERQANRRMPQLLTVGIDTAADDASSSGAAAAARAGGGGAGGGGSGYQPSYANWRAGVVGVSRSCALRVAPTAAVMAELALSMVKKWGRERGGGWRIIGLSLGTSNFADAPAAGSTLDRFMKPKQPQQQQQQGSESGGTDPAAGAAAAAAAGSSRGGASGSVNSSPAAPQRSAGGGSAHSSPAAASGSKGAAAAAAAAPFWPAGAGSWKRARGAQSDLRSFLAARPAAADEEAAAAAASAAEDAADDNADVEMTQLQQQQQQQDDNDEQQQQQQQQQQQDGHSEQQQDEEDDQAMLRNEEEEWSGELLQPMEQQQEQQQEVFSSQQQLQQQSSSPRGAAAPPGAGRHASLHSPGKPALSALAALGIKPITAFPSLAHPQPQPEQQQQVLEPQAAADLTNSPSSQPAATTTTAAAAAAAAALSQAAGGGGCGSSQPVVSSLREWLPPAHQQQQRQQGDVVGTAHLLDGTSTEAQQQQQQQQQQQLESPSQQASKKQRLGGTSPPAEAPQQQQQQQQQHSPPRDWQAPVKLADIDAGVLSELPWDIQLEVRRAAGDSRVAPGAAAAGAGGRPGRGRGSKRGGQARGGSKAAAAGPPISKFFSSAGSGARRK